MNDAGRRPGMNSPGRRQESGVAATMLQSLGGNCQTAISGDPIPLIKHS